ncbi:PAS domain-containing sensor histidine kinase [Haloarcula litorea]|uniref:sensor histidine kinase n=1 Tax=Haloarcula litorea TaxID=3032579 RepID=UPI0023E82A30|nr:PAS domain-containing sensor histidine kinase [Halomicroarcula sp. GDY20]
MGGDEGSAAGHALYLDTDGSRADRAADELEARTQLTVYTATGVEDALDRLAWPDVDVLVVGHEDGRFDGVAAAADVCDRHPILPVVLFAASEGAAEGAVGTAVDEFVANEGASAFDSLASAAAALADDQVVDDGFSTPDPPDRFAPNVDDERAERLASDGLDTAELTELLHKSDLFDAVFDSIPVHLYVKDRRGRHRYVSSGYFEESLPEFLGNTDPEIGMVADRHARRAYAEDMHVVESGEPVLDKVEYLPMLDQWNLTSKVPWYGLDGEVVGLIGVTRDISERRERQEEVKRQNERLDQFASLLSHDLRNPLQLASLRLELARDAEDPADHLDEVEAALDRMDELVDDVLRLAREGRAIGTPEPVALDDVVEVAWTAVDAPDATVERVEPVGTVLGDESRLRQLMANLFRNAIEHAGSAVTVSVGPLPDGEGFYVADDGPGFPDVDEDDLFDAGFTTSDQGTGFGLSIVGEIATAHGWTVTVADAGDGGARIEFRGLDRPDEA